MDFFSDLFPQNSKRDVFLYAAVLLPPTLIAIADPNIFRGALDLAGRLVYVYFLCFFLLFILSLSLQHEYFSTIINKCPWSDRQLEGGGGGESPYPRPSPNGQL